MPEIIQLSPSEVRYSQSSIASKFTDGTNLGEVLEDIIVGRCFMSGLPKINVVRQNGVWTTVDNRRLWIYKQLENLGRCRKIDVIVKKKLPPGRNTSKTGGASIRIRGQIVTRSGCILPFPDGESDGNDGEKYESNAEDFDSPPLQPPKPKKTRRRRPRKRKSKQVDSVPESDDVVDSAAAREETGSDSDCSSDSGLERHEENHEDSLERREKNAYEICMELNSNLRDLHESINDHIDYHIDQTFGTYLHQPAEDNGLEYDTTSSDDRDEDFSEEVALFDEPNTTRKSHGQIPESNPYCKVHGTSNRYMDQGYSSNIYKSGRMSTDQGYSSNSYKSGHVSADHGYSAHSYRRGQATDHSSSGLVHNASHSLYRYDYGRYDMDYARYGMLDPSEAMARAALDYLKDHHNTGRPRTSISSASLRGHTDTDQRCDVAVERLETEHYRVNQRSFPVAENKKYENDSWCAIL